MSALQAFVEQIETYGVLYYTYRTPSSDLLVKEFTIDSETMAVVIYNIFNEPKIAKFVKK